MLPHRGLNHEQVTQVSVLVYYQPYSSYPEEARSPLSNFLFILFFWSPGMANGNQAAKRRGQSFQPARDTDDRRALPRVSLLQDAGASPLRDDESASGHPHLGTALQVLL